jgi:chemotaxis protein MotB
MSESENRSDSYVLSMTDLMVGILFIVLIIVFYFAFINARNADLIRVMENAATNELTLAQQIRILTKKLKIAEQAADDARKKLRTANNEAKEAKILAKRAEEGRKEAEQKATAAEAEAEGAKEENSKLRTAYVEVNETKEKLLKNISKRMKDRGFPIKVDVKRGIIRLPHGKLFDSGEFELSKGGELNIGIMAEVMRKVLPCYVSSTHPDFIKAWGPCPGIGHKIEAIFLEGHTDERPVPPGGRYKNNAELAAKRALSAFSIINGDDVLKHMRNEKEEYLFGVSGYGKTRPICEEKNEDCYKLNRRIDLRFLMQAPKLNELIEKNIKTQ